MKTLNPISENLFENIATICKDYNEKHILNNPAQVDQYSEIAADENYKDRDMTIIPERKCPKCGDERMIASDSASWYSDYECILCDAVFSEYDCLSSFEQKKIDAHHVDDWKQFGNY